MDLEQLMVDFKQEYQYLIDKGLMVNGIIRHYDDFQIYVLAPFMFDRRNLPLSYKGLELSIGVLDSLPQEFDFHTKDALERAEWMKYNNYYAPERFEKFVDRCADEIREKLGNPNMSRDEMLDAIIGEDFNAFKENALKHGAKLTKPERL